MQEAVGGSQKERYDIMMVLPLHRFYVNSERPYQSLYVVLFPNFS